MTDDAAVPGYLGRILDAAGTAVGTCFQVSPGVLATACHVLDDIDAGRVDVAVRVDALAGGFAPVEARVAGLDQLRDLAVLTTDTPLPSVVEGLDATDTVPLQTGVVVTGVAHVDDPGRELRWLTAPGQWRGGTRRHDDVSLGRFSSPDLMPGMSGAPVRRMSDHAVVGVVSARYNSVDGWLRDSVWVARAEDLAELLNSLPWIRFGRRLLLAEPVRMVRSVQAPVARALPVRQAARAIGGPREAAVEAARVLVALDDSGRGIGEIGELVELLIDSAGRGGRYGDGALRSFRTRLRLRGLDPRLLLPSMPQHDEAVRRWIAPLVDESEPDVGSATMLAALTRALLEELTNETFGNLSPTCQQYLGEALLNVRSIAQFEFLDALAALLPPLRSTSLEAVPLRSSRDVDPASPPAAQPEAATSGHGSERYRQLEMSYIAAQMCGLPDADPCVAGRTDLIATIVRAVSGRVETHRSATAFLSGQPGVGTSTVAIEAARELIPAFPGGVLHIDLHGLQPDARRDALTVVRMVAEALDMNLSEAMDDASRFAAFAAKLRDRQVLLVLDNALDAAHVAPLVKAPTGCAIIVTSRDRLQGFADPGLVFRVEPLDSRSAIEVLARCDERRTHDHGLLHRVAYLCAQVPLALRMIGARLASRPDLALEYLVQVLEEETTRLDYLDAGDRAVRAAIHLSYDNLDPVAKRTFRLIAATPGSAATGPEFGYCLDTAALRQEMLLNRLVDRSLAKQELGRTFGAGILATFTLFDLVLLFARERLAEEEPEEVVRDFQLRSVSYLRDRLVEVVDQEPGADLSGELDPARFYAAVRLCEEREWFDLALDLAGSLHVLHQGRGEIDSVVAINDIRIQLHLRGQDPEAAVNACLLMADLMRANALDQAVEYSRRAARLAHEYGLPARVAEADFRLSILLWEQGQATAALSAGERSFTLFMAAGQAAVAVPVAVNNCLLARDTEAGGEALKWGRIATELADQWAEATLRASAWFERARAERQAGQHLAAVAANRRAEALYASVKDWWNAAVACANGALAACASGDLPTAVELARLAVDHWVRQGDFPHLMDALVQLSSLHVQVESFDLARQSLHEAVAVARDNSDPATRLLCDEVLLRHAAVLLFTAAGRPAPDSEALQLALAPATASGTQGEEARDPEVERVRDLLRRYHDGGLGLREARRQALSLLTAGTRNKPAGPAPWLHEQLNDQTSARQALGRVAEGRRAADERS